MTLTPRDRRAPAGEYVWGGNFYSPSRLNSALPPAGRGKGGGRDGTGQDRAPPRPRQGRGGRRPRRARPAPLPRWARRRRQWRETAFPARPAAVRTPPPAPQPPRAAGTGCRRGERASAPRRCAAGGLRKAVTAREEPGARHPSPNRYVGRGRLPAARHASFRSEPRCPAPPPHLVPAAARPSPSRTATQARARGGERGPRGQRASSGGGGGGGGAAAFTLRPRTGVPPDARTGRPTVSACVSGEAARPARQRREPEARRSRAPPPAAGAGARDWAVRGPGRESRQVPVAGRQAGACAMGGGGARHGGGVGSQAAPDEGAWEAQLFLFFFHVYTYTCRA